MKKNWKRQIKKDRKNNGEKVANYMSIGKVMIIYLTVS